MTTNFKVKGLRFIVFGLFFLCFTCPTEPTFIEIQNVTNNIIVLINKPGSNYKNEDLENAEEIYPRKAKTYDFTPTGLNNIMESNIYVFYFKVANSTDSLIIPKEKIIRGQHNTIVYK